MKRASLILAAFGYIMFLIAGMDTGLGVFRTPIYCWAAFACALIAVLCVSKRHRWFWSIAGVVAIAGSLYGYHQNSEWRQRLERFKAQESTLPTPNTATNK
jgi:hypothetical protein